MKLHQYACLASASMYVPVFVVQTDPIHARVLATI